MRPVGILPPSEAPAGPASPERTVCAPGAMSLYPIADRRRSLMSRNRFALGLGAVALLTLAGSVWADIRLNIPEDISPSVYTSPNGPSPFLPGVVQDGEWAAIPFYRPPECIPVDFNLMDWFDNSLAALDCPFLLEGFGIWPGKDPIGFPQSTQLRGLGAVPVWFVRWSELQEAMADGVLTIGELASLPSLRTGIATTYEEQLHYLPPHHVSHSTMVAHGTLDDGGSFSFYAIEIQLEWQQVVIDLP